jgi:hypothetical protein
MTEYQKSNQAEKGAPQKEITEHQITMTTYNGRCHCGQTNWTVKLDKEQEGHILWYVLSGHSHPQRCFVPALPRRGSRLTCAQPLRHLQIPRWRRILSEPDCTKVGFECHKGKPEGLHLLR